MSDFGTMKTRIKNEINREDIDSFISAAILTSLRRFRKEQLAFNQTTDTITATANVRYTAAPTDFQSPISVRLEDASSQFIPLTQRSYDEIERRYTSTSLTGVPYDYAIFQKRFYWWLVPQSTYTVYLSYVRNIPEPVADTDTSGWFTDAEALTRLYAKGVLYLDVLMDEQKAGIFQGMAMNELSVLKAEMDASNFNATLQASW